MSRRQFSRMHRDPAGLLRASPGSSPILSRAERQGEAGGFHIDYPDVVRKHLEKAPAEIRADWLREDLSLRFFFGTEDSVKVEQVAVEVRGEGNPIAPYLSKLCLAKGWIAQGPNGADLDLAHDWSADWERFKVWRETAIEQIQQRDGTRHDVP